MRRLVFLAALLCAAATAGAQTPHPDTLVARAYQALLDSNAFRFRYELRIQDGDGMPSRNLSGAGLATAPPPDGTFHLRLTPDDEPEDVIALDRRGLQWRSARTSRIYVDSTVQGLRDTPYVFFILHPVSSMWLYRMAEQDQSAVYERLDTVDARPCHRVALSFTPSDEPFRLSTCFDVEHALPTEMRMHNDAGAGGTIRLTGLARAGVPDTSAFALPLPAGWAYANLDGSDRPPPLALGTAAPAFALVDAAGQPVRLEDHRGKVVLLDFWGTWCGPCVAALPKMQALHAAHPDLVVLGLAGHEDDETNPEAFARERGATYRIARADTTVLGQYNVRAFPTYYVVGRDGTILFAAVHDDEEDAHGRLEAFLRSYFAR